MTDPSIFYTTNIGDLYGPRNYTPDPFHDGVDFTYNSGTDIPAPALCQVAGKLSGGDYGNSITVLIDSRYWAFCHMVAPSSLAVGEWVPYGGTLGQVGSTGLSTGAHLHVECTNIPEPGSGGTRQDPLPLLTAMVSGSQPSTGSSDLMKVIVVNGIRFQVGARTISKSAGPSYDATMQSLYGTAISLTSDQFNTVLTNHGIPWTVPGNLQSGKTWYNGTTY